MKITNTLLGWLILVLIRKGTWATNKYAWLAFTMNGTNISKDKPNVDITNMYKEWHKWPLRTNLKANKTNQHP